MIAALIFAYALGLIAYGTYLARDAITNPESRAQFRFYPVESTLITAAVVAFWPVFAPIHAYAASRERYHVNAHVDSHTES